MMSAAHGSVAQLVERETEDLRVDGSIPSGSAYASLAERLCIGLLSRKMWVRPPWGALAYMCFISCCNSIGRVTAS